MEAKDYVGKTVLVGYSNSPRTADDCERAGYTVVKVVGYTVGFPIDERLIVDGKGFGWVNLDLSDIIIEQCADYWYINIEDIEEVLA